MQKNGIVKGAAYLALGAFLVKLLGAIYRIPLVNLIGTEGLGVYQAVFPVFAILLDLSGAYLPTALSKIISTKGDLDIKINAEYSLSESLKLMKKVGLIGTAVMILLAYPLSILQGTNKVILPYIALSPSVFLVALISCYRGYFQGQKIMKNTAISQVIESAIKLALGLLIAKLLMPNITLAVTGATLSITASELISLIYLYLMYKKTRLELEDTAVYGDSRSFRKTLVKILLPVTLTGMAIPFSQFLDSFIYLNLLPFSHDKAISLFGLLSGATVTIISLPVGLCHGIATSSVPVISSLQDSDRQNAVNKSLILTAIVSSVLAVLTFIFAPIGVKILFSRLDQAEKFLLIRLLRLCAPCVMFLALLETINSLLIATDKSYFALIGLGLGVIVKIILSIILVPNPKINIYGGGISLIACYFVAVMINFTLLSIKGTKNAGKTTFAKRVNAI